MADFIYKRTDVLYGSYHMDYLKALLGEADAQESPASLFPKDAEEINGDADAILNIGKGPGKHEVKPEAVRLSVELALVAPDTTPDGLRELPPINFVNKPKPEAVAPDLIPGIPIPNENRPSPTRPFSSSGGLPTTGDVLSTLGIKNESHEIFRTMVDPNVAVNAKIMAEQVTQQGRPQPPPAKTDPSNILGVMRRFRGD